MRPTPRYRPNLLALEGRLLPTAAPAYPDPVRTAIHDSYVAEAGQGGGSVVFLGDSITYFWGTATNPQQGTATWNADFAPLKAENFGIPGDQTQNVLYRVQNGELSGSPKVAVVMIGINDLIGGRSPATAAAGVASVVNAIRVESPSTRVLLMGVLPTALKSLDTEVYKLNADLASLQSPQVTYLNIDDRLEDASGLLPTAYTVDGLHPSDVGYAILGALISGPIDTLLQAGPASVATSTPPVKGTKAPVLVAAAQTATTPTEMIPLVLDPTATNRPSTNDATVANRETAARNRSAANLAHGYAVHPRSTVSPHGAIAG